jgi:hypothetical protein
MYNRTFFILCTVMSLTSYADKEGLVSLREVQSVPSGEENAAWNARTPRKTNMSLRALQEPSAQSDIVAAKADYPESSSKKNRQIPVNPEKQNSHIELGAGYTYLHMKPSEHPALMGHLGGFQSSYEYKPVNCFYGAITFIFRDGHVDGSGTTRSILDCDVQERLGYTFGNQMEDWTFSLFSGLGYRHLGQKVSTNGNHTRFNYNDLYMPVGFLLNGKLCNCLALGCNFQWRPQVYPTVAIVPLHGARWDTTYKLANFMVEIPFTMVVSTKYHLSLILKPFFEYWQDGHTTAKTETGLSLAIPGNTYLFGGVDLNLGIAF